MTVVKESKTSETAMLMIKWCKLFLVVYLTAKTMTKMFPQIPVNPRMRSMYSIPISTLSSDVSQIVKFLLIVIVHCFCI